MTNRIGQATPGPWHLCFDDDADDIELSDASLNRICELAHFGRRSTRLATAHLIAAAPDMFEALELVEPALVAAVAEADAGGPNEGLDLLCGFVKRALAKARGEQPAREQVL
jgi:hypothetical protein